MSFHKNIAVHSRGGRMTDRGRRRRDGTRKMNRVETEKDSSPKDLPVNEYHPQEN